MRLFAFLVMLLAVYVGAGELFWWSHVYNGQVTSLMLRDTALNHAAVRIFKPVLDRNRAAIYCWLK